MITKVTKDAMRIVIDPANNIMPVFDVPPKRVDKYARQICSLDACKYKAPPVTWLQLLMRDELHFYELLIDHVPVESEAFHALLILLGFMEKVDVRMIKYELQKDDSKEYDDGSIIRHIHNTYSKPYRST